MNTHSLPRASRRIALVISAVAALLSARAQTPAAAVLDPVITTATRTAAAPQTLGTAVDFLSAEELARRQTSSLSGALGGIPGASHFSSGATGAISSLFLRGSNSNQTLFLVDGLRLNDPNTDYQLFLGGSCIGACDNLEVAHGPQSTLYGGEAIGGVVSLRAQRGRGEPAARIGFEAGSFGTVQGAVSAQGEHGSSAYNVTVQGGHTDNERPNNSFDSTNTTVRLDHTVNDRLAFGGTLRWFHGQYADPGDRFTNDPNNHESEENVLATAFADVKFAPAWAAHFTLGGQERRFVSDNPEPNPPYFSPAETTVVKNRRAVFDWQNTVTAIERHRITAGVTAEANHTRNTGFGDINKKQGLFALFAQDEFSPVENVFLTAGLRNDDFDTFGRATTGRVTAAWLVVPEQVKVRASYGTAFRSPSFLDLYGRSAFYHGNSNLDPERAKGWDTGLDFYLPNRRGTVSVTWFDTRFTDLITSTPDFSSVENVQRARTRGLEVSTLNRWGSAFETRLAYTYLEATNSSQGTRLLRRPRHSFDADAWHAFGRGVSVGAGLGVVAGRRDFDAATFETIDAEDYTVARVYAAWKASDQLTIKARVENLLNERYEQVNGYPSLGFGAYAGAEWAF